jgi:hypothetical protein
MRRLSDSLMDLAKASYDPNEISFSEIRLDEVLLESYSGTIKENPQYKVALHIDDTVEEQQLTIQEMNTCCVWHLTTLLIMPANILRNIPVL